MTPSVRPCGSEKANSEQMRRRLRRRTWIRRRSRHLSMERPLSGAARQLATLWGEAEQCGRPRGSPLRRETGSAESRASRRSWAGETELCHGENLHFLRYYASGDTKEKLLHEGCKNCQKMKKSKKTGAFTDFLPIHTITLACLLAITL